MRIGVLTLNNPHYFPVYKITSEVNRKYTESHVYTWLPASLRDGMSWAETVWQKITYLAYHLPKYDWLMWIDSDAMVMNHSIKLERIIESVQDTSHIIITMNQDGWNAGVFLLKNCPESHQFLSEVEAVKSQFIDHRYPEQEAMYECNRSHKMGTAYVPTWLLNQFWCTWMPGDFIVHHAGGSVEDKVKGLTPFLEKVLYV